MPGSTLTGALASSAIEMLLQLSDAASTAARKRRGHQDGAFGPVRLGSQAAASSRMTSEVV
jgi:hypothetical protein